MRTPGDGSFFFDLSLGVFNLGKIFVYGKTDKLPLDDAREPDKRADFVKPDASEMLLRFFYGETCPLKFFFRDFKRLFRKGNGRIFVLKETYELTVVVCAHLLGDKQAALFEHARNFFCAKITVSVDDHIEEFILKRNFAGISFLKVDAEGRKRLHAKLSVRLIALHGICVFVRVIER